MHIQQVKRKDYKIKIKLMDKQKTIGRYTEEDIQLIKGVFKGNDKLLRLVRKVFIPELTPENVEIVAIGGLIDIYGSISPDRAPEDVVTDVKARNLLLAHLNTQMISLQSIANAQDETMEELEARLKKNSTK